jgi:hypothetical protein
MPKGDHPGSAFLKAADQDERHESMEGSPQEPLLGRREIADADGACSFGLGGMRRSVV